MAKDYSIDSLDRVFSLYIRIRDSNRDGIVKCISCGKLIPWKQSDCGHYINRRHKSTRYDEMNCNAQCRQCNRFDEGNIQGYRRGLVQKYGEKPVENLEVKKYNTCKLEKYAINELYKQYSKKLKDAKNEKGIRG